MENLKKTTEKITLESVNTKLIAWRKNKNKADQKNIPDDLWLDIFELAEVHSADRVRHFFSLNSVQYNKKYKQLLDDEQC